MATDPTRLLNFNEPFDIGLLERVLSVVYNPLGNPAELSLANQILGQFKEHPQSWTRVDTILEHATHPNTKYFGLSILESLIRFRWNLLPKEQQTAIRNYLVEKIIALSTTDELRVANQVIVGKMNAVLVDILKQEWPANWPTFIPEIMAASQKSESICENNMEILKLLSEEVFDFSRGNLTRAKISELKDSLTKDFYGIYQLCEQILASSTRPGLIKVTLEALRAFLSWIPLGYIFETQMMFLLVRKFFPTPLFRNLVMQCMVEIAALEVPNVDDKFEQLFIVFMEVLYPILPPAQFAQKGVETLASAYQRGTEEDQRFIQNLALFFTAFFKTRLSVVERNPQCQKLLLDAHYYLLQISLVRDIEIFKICLEYWSSLTALLYHEAPVHQQLSPLNLGPTVETARRVLYRDILSHLRNVLISRMAKPEEILITEDENGRIIRQRMKATETLVLYKGMKETLVYLTHLDYQDTQNIMLEKLNRQVDGSEWSWNNLNTLCWAIGSIAGAPSEDMEKVFLVTVIRELLTMTDSRKGKDNKAVIASNIMYIVGQYPRFLKAHWRFLKTVINKLFEFMHEVHPGVQDMSCDTFLKIAKRCKRKFVTVQPGESRAFIEDIVEHTGAIISQLEDSQIFTFYQAVGEMISAHSDPGAREVLTARMMELPNQTWQNFMKEATVNIAFLQETEVMRRISTVLKTNERACFSLGQSFIGQLGRIYLDMLNVYKVYSQEISRQIHTQGPNATRLVVVKAMRAVKADSLKLIETFVDRSTTLQPILQNFMPPMMSLVLDDYRQGHPQARDAEVLSLMAEIVNKCKNSISEQIPQIFDAVFECTLAMITPNLEDFPEHRVQFFKLLRAVNANCFPALLAMSPAHFKLIIDSVVWAFKHTMREVAQTGLSILYELLDNVEKADVANQFFQAYFLPLLQALLFVLTDSFHKTGFGLQAKLLMRMFALIETGRITVPLFEAGQHDPSMNNPTYVRQFVANLISNAFPNLTPTTVRTFVVGLFLCANLNQCKVHLRDFLVQIKEFGKGGDNADLFVDDKEGEAAQRQQEETQRYMLIPGMIGPHDSRRGEHQPDDMAE